MTDAHRSDQLEFIWLDGHAVRVTSWIVNEQTGAFTLVTISRGSRDSELLTELLGQQHLQLRIPGQEPIQVRAESIDRRDVGNGQSAIARFAVVLATGNQTAITPSGPRSLEERIVTLENDVAELRELLHREVRKSNT